MVICQQNVIVTCGKSFFLPFPVVNCSFYCSGSGSSGWSCPDFLRSDGTERSEHLLQSTPLSPVGVWACVILCRIYVFFFIYSLLLGNTQYTARNFVFMSHFGECEFFLVATSPPRCLKWFGLTVLASWTSSAYLRSTRLTEGAFNLKGCTKEK